MREILFRGKRIDNGEWVEGLLFKYCGEFCIALYSLEGDDYGLYPTCYAKVDPSTVGQFTGLCDKNGNKIFEGDFLAIRNLYPHEVEYADGGFHMAGTAMLIKYANIYKVIGNKWDNPELLEGEG